MSLKNKVKRMAVDLILEDRKKMLKAVAYALNREGYGQVRLERVVGYMNEVLESDMQVELKL